METAQDVKENMIEVLKSMRDDIDGLRNYIQLNINLLERGERGLAIDVEEKDDQPRRFFGGMFTRLRK